MPDDPNDDEQETKESFVSAMKALCNKYGVCFGAELGYDGKPYVVVRNDYHDRLVLAFSRLNGMRYDPSAPTSGY